MGNREMEKCWFTVTSSAEKIQDYSEVEDGILLSNNCSLEIFFKIYFMLNWYVL